MASRPPTVAEAQTGRSIQPQLFKDKAEAVLNKLLVDIHTLFVDKNGRSIHDVASPGVMAVYEVTSGVFGLKHMNDSQYAAFDQRDLVDVDVQRFTQMGYLPIVFIFINGPEGTENNRIAHAMGIPKIKVVL